MEVKVPRENVDYYKEKKDVTIIFLKSGKYFVCSSYRIDGNFIVLTLKK